MTFFSVMHQQLTPRRAVLTAVCAAGLTAAGFAARAADAPPAAAPAGAFSAKAALPPTGDYVMWGGTQHRNMVSGEKNPPADWDVESGKNIKWTAELGSKAYGNPIIANGRVYVGTNNESKKDPKWATPTGDAIDGGVEMCFDAKTGKFLWQQYYSKLPSGRVNDWPGEGLCSTAYTEGDRVWYATNQCKVVCLDASASEPRELWSKDLMADLGVFPHNMTAAAITSYGDLIYLLTGNGVDDTHKNVVAPQAPGIVCLNKNDGKPVWTSNLAGENVLHGQWASVSVAEVNGRPLVIAPLGDAWVYAFDAKDGKLVWKFDSNPKESIYPQTRNEIIATPVVIGNKVYIANGQDPEHGTGYAHLWCIRIDKEGDISAELPADPNAAKPKPGEELVGDAANAPGRKGKPNPNSGVVWHFDRQDMNGDGKFQEKERMHRTISTVAVADGLVYAADFSGYLHCLDAETGKQYWAHDTEAEIWGSPMWIDGKVYVGNGDGDVYIFQAGREDKILAKHSMGAPVYGTPVLSHGTMYILSLNKLFAIGPKE